MSTKKLSITRPDDWHLHLRDGALMRAVLPHSSKVFARALIMPNLNPPVRDIAAAEAYRQRILDALPRGHAFTPLMTCYLTDGADPAELISGHEQGVFLAGKLYPAGATTNSAQGVTDVKNIYPVLEAMQKAGMPLSVHGEVTDPQVDIFDREAVFIERVLEPLRRDFPGLPVVFEHLTSKAGVDYVLGAEEGLAATITPHHMLISRNHILVGGIKPHLYCLPIAKKESDRLAIVRAAVSGDSRFFLGTDSAPHPLANKETSSGSAGIFCAPHALEWVAQVFDQAGALHNLENFTSQFGCGFYRQTPNKTKIQLRKIKAAQQVDAVLDYAGGRIGVFSPGAQLEWEIVQETDS